jgi:flagellar biosynthesis protein FlhF
VAGPARAGPPRQAPAPVAAPRTLEQNRRELLQTPAVSGAAIVGLSEEVGQLRGMLNELVRETRAQKAPQVPEEVFDHYLQLIQNQVAEELALDVVRELRKQLRPEHLRNPDFVREKLAEQIERMLPVSGPIQRSRSTGPHVVALIGPTGVGKTTTIAKLAANLSLRDGHRVGLITIDTYRIAAVEQLRKYADIIGSPLRVVTTPQDLRQAVESMADCGFVLIDTAGRSPTDTLKLNELKNFLAAARPDEVHLVLSTTASQACIEAAIARFGEVRVDKIIFTKLDEAVHVGVVLNVVRKVNKSLSYITTGQDVPNDIEVGRGRRLAQLILGQSSPGSSI